MARKVWTAFDLNPRFRYASPLPALTATREQLAEHVDHAIIALDGRAPFAGEVAIELLEPVANCNALRVELWVNDLDDCTCTYGFVVTNDEGSVPFARGERTVVNVDPASRRPASWSADFRMKHEDLRKDLPAYA